MKSILEFLIALAAALLLVLGTVWLVVSNAHAQEAPPDRLFTRCSALTNAVRVVVLDRLDGKTKSDELRDVLASKSLTPATRALYRGVIDDVYALQERHVRRYPQVVFSQCVNEANNGRP